VRVVAGSEWTRRNKLPSIFIQNRDLALSHNFIDRESGKASNTRNIHTKMKSIVSNEASKKQIEDYQAARKSSEAERGRIDDFLSSAGYTSPRRWSKPKPNFLAGTPTKEYIPDKWLGRPSKKRSWKVKASRLIVLADDEA
jgi:hypothetical protein